jgi:hypothetical protein
VNRLVGVGARGSDSSSLGGRLRDDDYLMWRARVRVDQWEDPDKLAWAYRRAERLFRRPTPADLRALADAHERALRGLLSLEERVGIWHLWDGQGLSGDQLALLVPPDDVVEREHNLLVNAGIQRLEDLLIGAGGQAYTNTYARTGTGNGSGTAAAGDTDLSAASGSANRWFQAMDATFPSRSAQTLTFKSTFASGDGNYAWNEWAWDQGGAGASTSGATVGAPLLNHKTSAALGTKASGATWAFTSTLVVS